MQFLSKLPNVGATIFTTISQLSAQHNAINLGQGFPDYAMNAHLIDLVYKAMQEGYNQYTHQNGYPLLTQKIAQKILGLYKNNVDATNEITITPGGTYAIYTALTTLLKPNDEVIVFEPAYDSYIPNIEINNAIAVPIALEFPHYTIPWHIVHQKINSKTKLIIINSPHNPTGMVLLQSDIDELEKIVTQYPQLYILSDEVYEHLIFDQKQHFSILSSQQLYQHSFVCFSFGKTYNATGFKLGYCVAPAKLSNEFRKVHQYNCFSCNTPIQVALAHYIDNQDAYLNLKVELQAKRDFFRAAMATTQFKLIPSFGSYFECYSYKNISNISDFDMASYLIKKYGVATIPVSAFYKQKTDNSVLRFCFAKQESTLAAAANKLQNIEM
jgi:methionine transaminase